ncbi:hypothetical protein DBR11_04985 [Pedobacter sp. HMWF019]|uniref:DUF6266 family protein n=1 Tax=Pedobacter sp. HMWF019 TaxID=2056856 RepID=UPI000D33F0AB|nr:DUF6266 family protein [Pedobacter sp. HMWF019]PTT02345.1 hypothetical protein DBR11_04985 [Pedobacter sp. HMWF019]
MYPGDSLNAHCIEGTPPSFEINHLQVSFSRGKLVGPNGNSIESVPGGKIKFEWLASAVASPLSNPADQLTIMVYNPTKKLFVTLVNAALRSALTYTLTCPAEFVGDDVYGYLSFVGINGKVSNSKFVGTVAIL